MRHVNAINSVCVCVLYDAFLFAFCVKMLYNINVKYYQNELTIFHDTSDSDWYGLICFVFRFGLIRLGLYKR